MRSDIRLGQLRVVLRPFEVVREGSVFSFDKGDVFLVVKMNTYWHDIDVLTSNDLVSLNDDNVSKYTSTAL